MLIFLVTVLLLAYITTRFFIGYKKDGYDIKEFWKEFWQGSWRAIQQVRMCLIIFMISVLIGLSIHVAIINLREPLVLQEMEMKRTIILEKLERIQSDGTEGYIVNGDIGSLGDVYNDLYEYNRKILSNRYFSNNLWVNWFFMESVGKLELIEVK